MLISRRHCLLLASGLGTSVHAESGGRAVLQEALADMRRTHEALPAGVPRHMGWRERSTVTMGLQPYGRALPGWWKGVRPAEWRAMLPWFTIYTAEGAAGGSPGEAAAGVEIGGIRLWVRTTSELRWRLIDTGLPRWSGTYSQDAQRQISGARRRPLAPPHVYDVAAESMIHGGLGQSAVPWGDGGADLSAILVLVRHRLVGLDAAGDVGDARLLVQAGLDYYPVIGAKVSDLGASFVPGAGTGRFLLARADWRVSTLLLVPSQFDAAELLDSAPDQW